MLVARGLLLLMMDADGATRVSDLAKLEEQLHKLTLQHSRYLLDHCVVGVHGCKCRFVSLNRAEEGICA